MLVLYVLWVRGVKAQLHVIYYILLYLVFTLLVQPLDAFKEVTKIIGDILGLER